PLRRIARSIKSHSGQADRPSALRRSTDAHTGAAWRNVTPTGRKGTAMSTPVKANDKDLRALAAIVSEDRPDLPDSEGLPPSLLSDLMGQIRCDALGLDSWDSGRQMCWFSQEIPARDVGGIDYGAWDQVFWENYWDCQHCSYA